MRELTALESGAYGIVLRTTDIAPLIESAVRSLTELSEASRVQVSSVMTVKSAPVAVDLTLITNALTQVLRNAIEHVAAESEQDRRTVTVELAEEGDTYVIRINNLGLVLSDTAIDQFFEPFTPNRARNSNGVGLGTTYAKLAIIAQGGQAAVTSDRSRGTTVTMSLPKADRSRTNAATRLGSVGVRSGPTQRFDDAQGS